MKTKAILISILFTFVLFSGCVTFPHEATWGIYALNLDSKNITHLYSSPFELQMVRLNEHTNKFVFCKYTSSESMNDTEIFTMDLDGSNVTQLTSNTKWDLYPAWSPDGTQIAFLSFQDDDLDIYVMNSDGSNVTFLYDSGDHDADIHWMDDTIVFTSNSSIWKINDDGTNPQRLTIPPRCGQWGQANLPFGDYDPQISYDGTKILFERLENDSSIHGNYNIYMMNSDGTGETRLTNTSYSQGFPTWSHTDEQIVYLISAIDDNGVYDHYLMNADGTNNQCITPTYVPDAFLCHKPEFSTDDSTIYFVGQWWE